MEEEQRRTKFLATHVMTEEASRKVDMGAVFYVVDPAESPLFCGTFVSSTLAVTVCHDPIISMWNASKLPVSAKTPAGGSFHFSVVSTNPELDFAVLRLSDGETSPAFFSIADEACVTAGTTVGLVTMGVGHARLVSNIVSGPLVSLHRINIDAVNSGYLFYKCGTLGGDSGGAVLLQDGLLVGLHLEVYDDIERPDPFSPTPADDSPTGKRRRPGPPLSDRVKALESSLSAVSGSASDAAPGHVCCALRLCGAAIKQALQEAANPVL